MALLVWFALGVGLWHFTVFVPDRFWGGIAGAFLGSSAGAVISGLIGNAIIGHGVGMSETHVFTAALALPGILAGLVGTYMVGVRREQA